MTKSANLPAPYGGVNELVPVASLENPFCENLLNFNVNQAGVSLRHGDSKYKKITATQNVRSTALYPYGGSNLFLTVFNVGTGKIDLYDVDSAAVVFSSSSAISTNTFQSLYFNKYLFFFCVQTLSRGFYYNGTTYGNMTYTTGTNPGLLPVGGDVYKERAYLIQYNEAAYWYTGISQVTDATPLTKVDLSNIISENSVLAIIAKLTIADNVATEEFQAFVFFNGEVLFYRGSYPDSADWAIIGRARISTPLAYGSFIAYQGDTLVFCDSGVISLRDLFLKGSEDAANLTVNARIQTTWSALVQAYRASAGTPLQGLPWVKGVWDQVNDRIIISFPVYINSSGVLTNGSFYFVFYTQLQSWFFHRSFGSQTSVMLDITSYNNKILTLSYSTTNIMVYQKEGATGFTDRNVNDDAEVTYDYNMLSAPIPFPKTAVYEATQIEPIIESDLYAQTNWNFVADFGRQTSGDQKVDAITTNVAKPAANVGMQNITYVQVKMSGTTAASKTVGLTLFSYNVWYNSGEVGSR